MRETGRWKRPQRGTAGDAALCRRAPLLTIEEDEPVSLVTVALVLSESTVDEGGELAVKAEKDRFPRGLPADVDGDGDAAPGLRQRSPSSR